MAHNAATPVSADRRTKPAAAQTAQQIAVRRARLLAKPPASRAAPVALRRLGRAATLDEVTRAARRGRCGHRPSVRCDRCGDVAVAGHVARR